jgi:hypothetical protein
MLRGLARTAAVMMLAGGMLFPALSARAQDPVEQSDGAAPQRGQFAGMQRAGGEVTTVSGANLTVKTPEGTTVQIVTTANTRMMKGRGVTVKISDVKVGDGVMAAGNLDAPNKTLHAAMLFVTDAAQLKAMKENLGKTYIAGKVTAIDADNAKMTVQRPDGVSQTIGFDETTSFKRGRVGRGMGIGGDAGAGGTTATAPAAGESITLADIKAGDNVYGTGSVKSGVFVPTQLTVGAPGQGRRRNGEGSPNAAPTTTPSPSGAPGPGTE